MTTIRKICKYVKTERHTDNLIDRSIYLFFYKFILGLMVIRSFNGVKKGLFLCSIFRSVLNLNRDFNQHTLHFESTNYVLLFLYVVLHYRFVFV